MDSCSWVLTLSRSKHDESSKQVHAVVGLSRCLGRRPCSPVDTLPRFPPLNAPLPAALSISPCCQCHPSLQTPPSCPHMALCSSGSSQFQMVANVADPRKGRGRQQLRDLGKVGKVLQRGNLRGQRLSKAQGPGAFGSHVLTKGQARPSEAQTALLSCVDKDSLGRGYS